MLPPSPGSWRARRHERGPRPARSRRGEAASQGLAQGRLTTVAGCSHTELFAVGSRDLLVSDGTSWRRADPLLVNDVNGVSCVRKDGRSRAVVVGGGSLKLRLLDGTWLNDFGEPLQRDLHGAWADPTGAFWGVGGQFAAAPRAGARRQGVVARWGVGAVPGTLAR